MKMINRRKFQLLACSVLLLVLMLGAIQTISIKTAQAQTNTISVNRSTTYQTIWGFGAAANHPAVDLYTKFTAANQTAILDKMFGTTGNNAGLSLVRLEINPFSTAAQDPNGRSQLTFEPYDGVWDWNTDAAQRWLAQEAMNRGDVNFVAMPWSPPGWMKTNGSPTGGGSLRTDMYDKFTNYLLAYLDRYRNTYGLDIRWLSIQNEPSNSTPYASNTYTTGQMDTVAAKVADAVHAQFPTVKVGAPEGATRDISVSFLNGMSATTKGKLDFIPTHDYTGTGTSISGYGKLVLNTEVWSESATEDTTINDSIRWATAIKDALNRGEPGWMYWWLMEPTDKVSAEGLINLYDNGTYATQRRLYAIGQFSRFMRPDDVRISATSNNSGLTVVASKDASGRAAIVVINSTTGAISSTVSGLTKTALQVYRTSSTENLAQLSNIAVSGTSATVSFAAQSITTLVEVDGAPTATPTKTSTRTPTPTTLPAGTVFIEAGGAANFTDSLGNIWLADTGFTAGAGGVADRGAIAIANTVEDRIYQTERWGMTAFAYNVPNGTYQVNLHFAETYTGITAAGQRVFSANVEGTNIANIDVFAQAGGLNTALIKTATVNVTDGQLNITFTASANNPEINGIQIIPVGPALTATATRTPTVTATRTATPTVTPTPNRPSIRVEAGGAANFTDTSGNLWLADTGFTAGAGGVVDRGAIAIGNTVNDRIYQTERWGMTAFAYPVTNGAYQVNLHFAETYTGITAAGQRVFSANVEGTAISNIDVFAQAGGLNNALVKSTCVNVADGQLSIAFTATANNPEINGVEIVPVTSCP